MTRRKIAILVVLSSALAAVGGTLAARWTSVPERSTLPAKVAPFLELEQTSVGTVSATPAAQVKVRIRNAGSIPIRLDRIATNFCDSTVSPSSCTISPGDSVTIDITLDLTPQYPSEFGRLTRPFEFQLTAETRTPAKKFGWQVKGTCRAALAVNTSVLHLGEANIFGRTPVSRSLTVLVADSEQTVKVHSDTPGVRVLDIERFPGRAVVRVAPDTDAIRGSFSAHLRVESVAPDGRVAGSADVEVHGIVRNPGDDGRTER